MSCAPVGYIWFDRAFGHGTESRIAGGLQDSLCIEGRTNDIPKSQFEQFQLQSTYHRT